MSQHTKDALAALQEAQWAAMKKLDERHAQERDAAMAPFTKARAALVSSCEHRFEEGPPHPHNGDCDDECVWCGVTR